MDNIDAFLEVFGNITVADVVKVVLAIAFLIYIAKQVRDYLIKKHEAEEKKDAQLKEVLDAVHKYPEWHQQSIDIRDKLEEENNSIRKTLEEVIRRLDKNDEDTKRRERNRIRESLLQNYRYFTSRTKNPMQAWTKMESEAFWEQFKDYTKAGGNGHIHSEVQPAMRKLEVIEMHETEKVTELMHSRR